MRHSFTVYTYDINLDGETKRIEKPFQIDYKQTIANYKAKGYNKVWIPFVNKYVWSE